MKFKFLTFGLRFTDPIKWDSSHVQIWLRWCVEAFSLPTPNPELFSGCTGQDILGWNLAQWKEKLPDSGSILARHIGYYRLQISGQRTEALNQVEDEISE